ncbi:MAG: YihY/virulence factor BrkB family protein [Thermoanaerobaculia bacterium]
MIRFITGIRDVLAEVWRAWQRDAATGRAAAVAFFATFSLAPLLLLSFGAVGALFSRDSARHDVISVVRRALGDEAGHAVEGILTSVAAKHDPAITIVGIVALLFGASGVFEHLRRSLNAVLKVQEPPRRGWRALIWNRLVAVLMVVSSLLFVFAGISLNIGISWWSQQFPDVTGIGLWRGVSFVAFFVLMAVMFGSILKFVPDMKLKWRHVAPGALSAAFIFTAAQVAVALYFDRSGAMSAYGGASSVLVALVMIFIGVVALLAGAELTDVLGRDNAEFQARQQERQKQT